MGYKMVSDGLPDLYVDNDGRAWDSPEKFNEYDPKTYKPIPKVAVKASNKLEKLHPKTLAKMLGRKLVKGETKAILIKEILDGRTHLAHINNTDNGSSEESGV